MADVFVFRWQVYDGGYQWAEGREEHGDGTGKRFLVAVTPPFTSSLYVPLESHPALYRVLLETPPTEEGVLAFANEYGWLGGVITQSVCFPNDKPVGGESLEDWQREIVALHRAVKLWDATRRGDGAYLGHRILWKENEVRYQEEEDGVSHHSLIASTERQADIFALLRRGEVGPAALYYIQQAVNAHIEGRVSPRLLWNKERSHLDLYVYPNSLIGALWLQFARAIGGDKDYHRCTYCGKWFEVSLQEHRSTKVYCSDACRFKTYRKRQEEACTLHTQGIPLKEIAKRLETDTPIVKGWIEKGKERQKTIQATTQKVKQKSTRKEK